MDHWGPKHVELTSVTNKHTHKTLCILLDYIYSISYSVGQPTFILSHDPPHLFFFSTRRTSATKVDKRRAQGRNSESEQNGRWLADANLYKKCIWLLNETLTSQGNLLPWSNLERAASRCMVGHFPENTPYIGGLYWAYIENISCCPYRTAVVMFVLIKNCSINKRWN